MKERRERQLRGHRLRVGSPATITLVVAVLAFVTQIWGCAPGSGNVPGLGAGSASAQQAPSPSQTPASDADEGSESSFVPSEEVSADRSVSFPADI